MFDLLGLPNEILYRIIECLDLGDLEHFFISCPLLECLAKIALRKHHTRKRKYTILHGCHNHEENQHPLDLLREICRSPQVEKKSGLILQTVPRMHNGLRSRSSWTYSLALWK